MSQAQTRSQTPWDIDVEELARMRERGEDFFLLDVREPHEVEICSLGGTNIPLGELPKRLDEVPKDRKVIVHCKLGGRSAKAVQLLRDNGYENVWNLCGGIAAWSERVDPSVPKY